MSTAVYLPFRNVFCAAGNDLLTVRYEHLLRMGSRRQDSGHLAKFWGVIRRGIVGQPRPIDFEPLACANPTNIYPMLEPEYEPQNDKHVWLRGLAALCDGVAWDAEHSVAVCVFRGPIPPPRTWDGLAVVDPDSPGSLRAVPWPRVKTFPSGIIHANGVAWILGRDSHSEEICSVVRFDVVKGTFEETYLENMPGWRADFEVLELAVWNGRPVAFDPAIKEAWFLDDGTRRPIEWTVPGHVVAVGPDGRGITIVVGIEEDLRLCRLGSDGIVEPVGPLPNFPTKGVDSIYTSQKYFYSIRPCSATLGDTVLLTVCGMHILYAAIGDSDWKRAPDVEVGPSFVGRHLSWRFAATASRLRRLLSPPA